MNEMSQIISVAAFISFLPISLFALRKQPTGGVYWLLLICPFLMSIAYSLVRSSSSWHTDFVSTLWISIATTLAVFIILCITTKNMQRLTILFLPYMALFAASATLWSFVISSDVVEAHESQIEGLWLIVHIASSVLTYALITLAATAALAVYIREWALKSKRKSTYVDMLPAMADGERLQIGLMVASELVLGVGLLSGIATEIMQGGNWLSFDHKIILSFSAFIVLGLLLVAHFETGIRGQKAARILLLCYLLVTMGFPGVKFVSDVLIGY